MDSTQTTKQIIKANNIEAILASLDNIKRAKAPPFLFGRIQAKLSQPEHRFFEKIGHLLSRPAVAISLLFLIIFIDGIVFESTYVSPPAKFENTFEEFPTNDDFDEALFYSTAESEYASIY